MLNRKTVPGMYTYMTFGRPVSGDKLCVHCIAYKLTTALFFVVVSFRRVLHPQERHVIVSTVVRV